jgi:prepilin-type N-terminal cleavage/methylation domain
MSYNPSFRCENACAIIIKMGHMNMTSQHTKKHEQGFTLVELLIVIIVIAILAAITIVGYNGIANRAHESALKSELSQAFQKIGVYKNTTGSDVYPPTIEAADVRMNASTSFFYTPNANATGYCLSGTNPSQKYYYITADNGGVREGKCLLTVSTFAGSGAVGSFNSTGTAAQFNNPTGAAFSANGDMYVADYDNHQIRRITPAGVVSLFAGSVTGESGSTNGQGTAARFWNPSAIAISNTGILYVTDQNNNSVRKISPSGMVETFATGFGLPWSLTVDAAGNVYVADTYFNMIKKITPSGTVSILAGAYEEGHVNGTGSAARFNYPSGIAIGPDGVLYVADQDNNRIRKVTTSGVVSPHAGSGDHGTVDGIGEAARFASPHGIATDVHGNVYVADEYSHSIRKIAPDGSVYTIAGSPSPGYQDGLSDVAKFAQPIGLATSSDGSLYVVERANHRIRVIRYQTL